MKSNRFKTTSLVVLSSFLLWAFLTLFNCSNVLLSMYAGVNPVSPQTVQNWEKDAGKLKSILVWNGYYRIELSSFGLGHQAFVSSSCPVSNCFITQNRTTFSNLTQFDAILFNIPVLHKKRFPQGLPRSPRQRYIFFSQESPNYNEEDLDDYRGFFNWTMSYPSHSDIQYRYGRITHSQKPETTSRGDPKQQTTNFASGKTRLVAWFVSHCYTYSRREKYAHYLQKYIPVDIYGGCFSALTCSYNDTAAVSDPSCYQMLEKRYKFYLSFENSFCKEYVTEKFFNILKWNVVPVVLGGADYSKLAPPHSYIDASKYSPKELAAYLKLLNENDTLYNEYFWWKPYYRIDSGYDVMSTEAFCKLCEKLNNDEEPNKVYDDLKPLWSSSTQCNNPKYKGVLSFLGFLK